MAVTLVYFSIKIFWKGTLGRGHSDKLHKKQGAAQRRAAQGGAVHLWPLPYVLFRPSPPLDIARGPRRLNKKSISVFSKVVANGRSRALSSSATRPSYTEIVSVNCLIHTRSVLNFVRVAAYVFVELVTWVCWSKLRFIGCFFFLFFYIYYVNVPVLVSLFSSVRNRESRFSPPIQQLTDTIKLTKLITMYVWFFLLHRIFHYP